MALYVVRYGAMRLLGVFKAHGEQTFARLTEVIVRTDRGLEAGVVLAEADQEAGERFQDGRIGQILRAATPDDKHELVRIHEQEERELQVCKQFVEKLNLPMQLVDVEHIFGGERIIVYYLADGRVDFRELVRMLAGEFQTRIEMRQIGVRDEAKLLADFGDCGKPVCCNTHLVTMPPVSMKMAKLQKATLDPSKISGRCGRLKCCLRFEFDTYEQLQRQLPPVGTRVDTPSGPARIIGHEVLSQQVWVETEDRVRKLLPVGTVQVADSSRGERKSSGSRPRPATEESKPTDCAKPGES